MAKLSNGEHLGRTTDLGKVTYFFKGENLYEITCKCGATFTARAAKAREGSLGCKDCIRAMMAAYGKKGNDKQVAKMQALVGTEHNIHDLLNLEKPE